MTSTFTIKIKYLYIGLFQELAINLNSPVEELKPAIAQAPRFLDQVVANAEKNGYAYVTAKIMENWCRGYFIFQNVIICLLSVAIRDIILAVLVLFLQKPKAPHLFIAHRSMFCFPPNECYLFL